MEYVEALLRKMFKEAILNKDYDMAEHVMSKYVKLFKRVLTLP